MDLVNTFVNLNPFGLMQGQLKVFEKYALPIPYASFDQEAEEDSTQTDVKYYMQKIQIDNEEFYFGPVKDGLPPGKCWGILV